MLTNGLYVVSQVWCSDVGRYAWRVEAGPFQSVSSAEAGRISFPMDWIVPAKNGKLQMNCPQER